MNSSADERIPSACQSISARLHAQCFVENTGSRFSRKRRSKASACGGRVLAVTAILQLVFTLLGEGPNPQLVRFGASLALYSRDIIDFLTFSSAKVPYPFTAWPEPPTSS